MPMPNDRITLDISFKDFDYAINACLERCNTTDDATRLTREILRVMKIRESKEATYRKKVRAVAQARKKRW